MILQIFHIIILQKILKYKEPDLFQLMISQQSIVMREY